MSKEKEIEEQPLIFEEEKPEKGCFSRIMLLLKIVAVIGLLGVIVMYLPLFRLAEINVKGNRTVNSEDICRIAGVKQGEHILSIKTAKIAADLQKDLRIEEARAERVFPNGLEIHVQERQPVAFIGCDFGYLDLDGNGIVLDAYRYPKKREAIVFISGIKLQDLYVGDKVKEDEIRGILLYLRSINPELRQYLTELSVANREQIVVRTNKGAEIRLGKPERFSEKARHTENFLKEFALSSKVVEYVNFQYKSPVIKFK